MKGELTITVPFELEKYDHVNNEWPPAPGEEEVDGYMLSTLLREVLHRLGNDIPLVYSSGYFHGGIYFSKATITQDDAPAINQSYQPHTLSYTIS